MEAGATETILFRDGFLTEASSSNVFVVKNGAVLAPPRDNLILMGITYDLVMQLARDGAVKLEVRQVPEAEVRSADEIWLSSSTKEVLAVTTLDGRITTKSNRHGGMLGGISSGLPIVLRCAVKPTSSLSREQETVTAAGKQTTISTKGRHDPCVGIRAVPIGEAMVACVIADHYLRQRGQMGASPAWPFQPPGG